MATKLPAVLLADLSIALASEIAVAGTTATLSTNLDKDGVTIPDGLIYLTLDGSNSSKEHIQAVKTGTALASIFSVSRQGVLTSGVARKHRIGASVALTDFATIKFLSDLLKGTTNLDSTTPLTYDGTATISNSNSLATKAYVDATAVAGAPNASTTVKGIIELATQAESDARTTTGATGALLVNSTDTQRSTLLSDGVNEVGVVATLTIATPCVITYTAHGLVANDTIQLTTTGALPTGLTVSTTYYVIATGLTANTFQISATLGGSAINTTGSQSGVHSLFRSNQYVFNTTPATTALAAFKEFSFRAVNANTTATPTVIINGLTATNMKKLGGSTNLAIGDINAGMNVKLQYDGTNFQMVNPSGLPATSFGGSGADGVLSISSGTITIDLLNSTFFQKNYSSINITGTGKIAFTNPNANGTMVIFKCRGNFVNTSSVVGLDLSSVGAAGGATQTSGASSGNPGNLPNNSIKVTQTGSFGAGGVYTGSGSGGGVRFVSPLPKDVSYYTLKNPVELCCGAGGGSGSVANAGTGGAGGAGGRGGGAIYLEVGGDFNFTGSMSVAGGDGIAGTGNNGSGGGGGSAGTLIALYGGNLIANTGVVISTGGNGATSVNNGYGNQGGSGAGSNSAVGGSGSGNGNGGAGSLGSGGGGTCNFGATPYSGGAGGASETNIIAKNNYY